MEKMQIAVRMPLEGKTEEDVALTLTANALTLGVKVPVLQS